MKIYDKVTGYVVKEDDSGRSFHTTMGDIDNELDYEDYSWDKERGQLYDEYHEKYVNAHYQDLVIEYNDNDILCADGCEPYYSKKFFHDDGTIYDMDEFIEDFDSYMTDFCWGLEEDEKQEKIKYFRNLIETKQSDPPFWGVSEIDGRY